MVYKDTDLLDYIFDENITVLFVWLFMHINLNYAII